MKKVMSLMALLILPQLSLGQLATPNLDGISYGHVYLNVSDISEHAQLWMEHFDGELIRHGPLTIVKFPNLILILNEQTPTLPSQDTPMDHFGFKVRNIDNFLTNWRAAGLDTLPVFTGAEGQTNAYVMMPDGVYVELQEDQSLHEEITGYHIHYRVSGHEELLQWYTQLLNSEIKSRGNIATTTNVPGLNLSFGDAQGRDRVPYTQGTAIDHIGFEIRDLAQFCQELEAKGIEFDVPYRELPELGLAEAFITDPAGVRIQFTEGTSEL